VPLIVIASLGPATRPPRAAAPDRPDRPDEVAAASPFTPTPFTPTPSSPAAVSPAAVAATRPATTRAAPATGWSAPVISASEPYAAEGPTGFCTRGARARASDGARTRVAARAGALANGAARSRESRVLDADLRARLRARFGGSDLTALDARRRLPGRIVVPVRFHMVTDGRLGLVSRASVRRQIDWLNAAYGGRLGGAPTGVSFRLVSVGHTANRRWFQRPREHQRPMMRALHRGGPGTLTLVTAGVGADLLGFSTFPQWYRRRPDGDGVVVDYRSLPGGEFRDFGRGSTAVHEIGHWLGLFHTFENGCARPGDHVADTPYESAPTQGCPSGKDTCPAAGDDPVHNFMDYSRDACMREFTRGQARRIRAAWTIYRR
jgi:hypothetical protein